MSYGPPWSLQNPTGSGPEWGPDQGSWGGFWVRFGIGPPTSPHPARCPRNCPRFWHLRHISQSGFWAVFWVVSEYLGNVGDTFNTLHPLQCLAPQGWHSSAFSCNLPPCDGLCCDDCDSDDEDVLEVRHNIRTPFQQVGLQVCCPSRLVVDSVGEVALQ